MTEEQNVLKVGAQTKPQKLASAIVNVEKEQGYVSLQAIGKEANAQAVKAVAIANNFVKDEGVYFTALPRFVEVEIEDATLTGMRIDLIKHEE